MTSSRVVALTSHLSTADTANRLSPPLKQLVDALSPKEAEQLRQWFKDDTLSLQSSDPARALLRVGTLNQVADLTKDARDRALALRLEGYIRLVSFREQQEALKIFEQSKSLYEECGDLLGLSQLSVPLCWALAVTGAGAEAIAVGTGAIPILKAHACWSDLATLYNNLAAIHGQQGDYQHALAMLDGAVEAFRSNGLDSAEGLFMAHNNRAYALRLLGRFDASIAISQQAIADASAQGADMLVAILWHTLGDTYFVSGRVHEAMQALDEARALYAMAERRHDVILVDQEFSRGLLYIGRHEEALLRAERVATFAAEQQLAHDVAAAELTCGLALAGLGRLVPALERLHSAETHYRRLGNDVEALHCRLEQVSVHLKQHTVEAAQSLLASCRNDAAQAQSRLYEARTLLLLTETALLTENASNGQSLALQALDACQPLPVLRYRAHQLLGDIAAKQGHDALALEAYERAIDTLEALQGLMLPQFRPNFLEDKESLYGAAVATALRLKRPEAALELAERAKARALLAMTSHRLTNLLEPKTDADRPLVDALRARQADRDLLLRRWESAEFADADAQRQTWETIVSAEKELVSLWQRLLTQNADYQRDALLWRVQVNDAKPHLKPNSVLLEYFVAANRIILFVATQKSTQAITLAASPSQISQKTQQLLLSFAVLQKMGTSSALTQSAKRILAQLYDCLLRPALPLLDGIEQLIIVPHASIHYVPFAALYDGQHYLVESTELRQLPASSFLPLFAAQDVGGDGIHVCGYTNQKTLAHILTERNAIAAALNTHSHRATKATLLAAAPSAKLLHIAAHGVFRADNPLFSGLELADGWLTTMDVFGWRLSAELVTLSACDTGKSVIGGGDELLGLMQAFLTAGAASLVMTHWSVDDVATAQLMVTFYKHLKNGKTRARALQLAQCALLNDERYAHPFFWAAFMLIGADGEIALG